MNKEVGVIIRNEKQLKDGVYLHIDRVEELLLLMHEHAGEHPRTTARKIVVDALQQAGLHQGWKEEK